MNEIEKNQKLQNCNSIPVEGIIKLIETGNYTLDEFISAGLHAIKVESVQTEIRKIHLDKKKHAQDGDLIKQKNEHLSSILRGVTTADAIKSLISRNILTFDDILHAGVSSKTVNALKYYCSTDKITRSYTIDQLPPMEEGRTDVYFVGLPGSGKSTMIAGLLNSAFKSGVLLPDPYHAAGVTFQTDLIQDLNRGVLPERTVKGSYNYIAAALNDSNEKRHPLNIVDVPGELYEKIQNNSEVEKFLKYINNKNKKILIFVIDSLAHEDNESLSKFNQSVVFPNILQIFNSNGVLENTDAIYLIVNKFDSIKESKYPYDDRPSGDIALEFLNQEFLSLKNNCLAARKDTKNSIKIKVMPFSIGSLSYGSILNTINKDFAKTILNQITKDSFIVTGGSNKIFK